MLMDRGVTGTFGDLSVAELGRLLDDRVVSAEELVIETCRCLNDERHDLNAVVSVTVDRAVDAARLVDRARAAGGRGPLLGIPFGVKDIIDVRGTRTSSGCAAVETADASADARVVSLLEGAGAPLVGKFSLAELIGLAATDPSDSLVGPIRNPWDNTRWAGGSSGGSAAAVAAGLVPFALGSETAGSIGAPAAWCGVTALRPSLGAVSRDGVAPLAPTLDKVGIFAKSAQDCETVFDVIAENGAADWPEPAVTASEMRVGYVASDFTDDAPAETRAQYREALEAVGSVAMLVDSPGLAPHFAYRDTLDTIMQAEAWRSFASIRDGGRLDLVRDDHARAFLGGAPVNDELYRAALAARLLLIEQLGVMFESVDAIVTTNFALPWPIPLIGEPWTPIEIRGGNTAMVWASNLVGLPAVFVPVGLAGGLPVSIQLVGSVGSDLLLLALAQSLQKETLWHRLRPPVEATG
jgi:aspartyl-tRNA(Asn)/glutamyl-tRNA(Gln) amidotransferase subunit A